MTIAYVPTILRSMEEIKKAFGVGPTVVKAWVEHGAPIAVEGEKKNTRYSAELARLQLWREELRFDSTSTEDDPRDSQNG